MTEKRVHVHFRHVHFRWLCPEGESAGDVEFTCECGLVVKREQVNIYDAITCECGIRYKFRTEAYVVKEVEEHEKEI